MSVERDADVAVSRIAAAIGERARASILYCLLDNRARTSTELAVVANVSPSTASVHLSRLKAARLIKLRVQGKHRYYSLESAEVAAVLEGMSVLAGRGRVGFKPNTPSRLRRARTCYDHIAGALGVAIHDSFQSHGWIAGRDSYVLTPKGIEKLEAMGVDLGAARSLRRRFAFGCLDWSERRSHIGGALGAALLHLALSRRWVAQDLDSRALSITARGAREMANYLNVRI
ncbi:MAG TPA: helix-turn-helix transcriptional regulator [Bryobacteraceae bacterium]|nr:helix-turn-helix transcriptional regulator [Bryobacteraceae bacterium]